MKNYLEKRHQIELTNIKVFMDGTEIKEGEMINLKCPAGANNVDNIVDRPLRHLEWSLS